MIKGKSISLQLVTEKHLDMLYAFHLDIANRGEYFPLDLTPEPLFKTQFRETGFWTGDFSRLLLIHEEGFILGSIWAMQTISYFDSLEIGYIIYDKKNYGKGYMTEALSLFVDYLFKVKNINRLEIRTLPSNVASEKIALKCGFSFEALIKGAIFHHGTHHDLRQLALLRKDWLSSK